MPGILSHGPYFMFFASVGEEMDVISVVPAKSHLLGVHGLYTHHLQQSKGGFSLSESEGCLEFVCIDTQWLGSK